MKKKIKVFYDGNCKICDQEISYYKKNDINKKFEWVNIHNSKSKINRLNLQKKELMDVLHIETESGKILKGVDAFLEIWANFKYFRFFNTFSVDCSDLDTTDTESFVDSLIFKYKHLIQEQDENQDLLKENEPVNVDEELDLKNLIGNIKV